MINQSNIAYFIDFSIQEIPSIAFITSAAGGTIYTNSELTFRFIKEDHPKLHVQYLRTVNEIKRHMVKKGIKVIVYPDYHIRFFKDLPGVKHVQVFHGTSDKVYDYRRDVLEYDLFFIPGREAHNRYRKKGLLKRGTGILIGYSKLDRVFRGELKRNDELVKLGLDPTNKTVLYAPTWIDRAGNSSWKKFRSTIAGGAPGSINLIVKLHPNLTQYRKNEVEDLKGLLDRHKNSRIFDALPDIIPLMAASDLLIGDVSAVTREYLAFRRPYVFLSNRPRLLWSTHKTELWKCGEVVTRPDGVWPAVKRSLENPERFLNRIEEHFRKTFYKPDGKAAERARDAIFSL